MAVRLDEYGEPYPVNKQVIKTAGRPPKPNLLGKSIRFIRQMRRFNQDELAVLADTTQQEISMTERGRNNPSRRTLEKIAKALDANLMMTPAK